MDDLDLIDDERTELQKRIKSISNLPDRLRHLAIDFILILGMLVLIKNLFLSTGYERGNTGFIIDFSVLLLLYFAYYVFLEFQYGLTVGKWLNKTRVVNESQEKPSFKAVVIRAVIRPIPFQFVLRLFPYQRTLHDLLSKTWVVRIH